MSLILLITIGVAIINTVVIIICFVRGKVDGALAFLLSLVMVGMIGFGFICGFIVSDTVYTKLNPIEVEYKFYENSSNIIMVYGDKIYSSGKIKDLNAINNLDYFVFEEGYNAYGGTMKRRLHIVEKGKVDDYIEKALK